MFREEDIAVAQMAQIFGSELLKVQVNAQTDSGHQPEIVKIHPKQFLTNNPNSVPHNVRRQDELHMIQQLQREAESAYPMAPEPQYVPPPSQQAIPNAPNPGSVFESLPIRHVQEQTVSPAWSAETALQNVSALERIALSLERIANVIDKVEIKTKRKTIKRRKTKQSGPMILNETHTH